jgi:hypothetical protein
MKHAAGQVKSRQVQVQVQVQIKPVQVQPVRGTPARTGSRASTAGAGRAREDFKIQDTSEVRTAEPAGRAGAHGGGEPRGAGAATKYANKLVSGGVSPWTMCVSRVYHHNTTLM